MSKTKIKVVTTLNGVSVHQRQKDDRTDYILSRQAKPIDGKERAVYISKFNAELQRPEIVSYKTQHEAETAAIFEGETV